MKKITLTLLLGIVALTCAAQRVYENVELKDDGTNRQIWWGYNKKETRMTRLDGYCRANKETFYTQWYFNEGVPKQGEASSYYNDGTLYAVVDYDDQGRFHGIMKDYYQGGNMRQLTEWNHGVVHGRHSTWHINGKKSYQGQGENGLRRGVCMAWRDDGQILSEYNYLDDKEHGKCTTWIYEDDGKPKGIAVFNYKHGTLADSSLYYIFTPDGREKLQSRTMYSSDGTVTLSESFLGDIYNRMEYKDGELVTVSMFERGKLQSVAQYLKNALHGDATIYYPQSNRIYRIDSYNKGAKIAQLEFDISGAEAIYRLFDDQGREHICDQTEYEQYLRAETE